MPDSVLTPAPVKTTGRRAEAKSAARRAVASATSPAMPPAMLLLERGPRGRLGTRVAGSGGPRFRATRLGSSRGARLRLAFRTVSGADVRVVAAPDVATHHGAG